MQSNAWSRGRACPTLCSPPTPALIFRNIAVPARFRHPQRQVEEPYAQQWLAEHGFELRKLKPDTFFEGAGDALFCGDTLLAGYRIRTAIAGHHEIGDLLGCRVISLELVDPRYYHLDTCFCPLAPGVAIYYPLAFDEYGQRALKEVVQELIPVEESEAWNFACNAVVVGRTVVTNVGCPELHRQLQSRGYTPDCDAAGRIRQVGRVGQMLDAAVGWGRSGGVEDVGRGRMLEGEQANQTAEW